MRYILASAVLSAVWVMFAKAQGPCSGPLPTVLNGKFPTNCSNSTAGTICSAVFNPRCGHQSLCPSAWPVCCCCVALHFDSGSGPFPARNLSHEDQLQAQLMLPARTWACSSAAAALMHCGAHCRYTSIPTPTTTCNGSWSTPSTACYQSKLPCMWFAACCW